MKVTAKVICTSKVETGDDTFGVQFSADYDDDRNKEWAKYTPSLSLSMNLVGKVARQFEKDSRYTLTFEPSDSY